MAKDQQQWELVTKSRKQKQLEQKIITTNEQKRAKSSPKLEELLLVPAHKLRNLSKGNDSGSSNSSGKSKSTSPKANAKPKPAKQQVNGESSKTKQKPQDVVKTTPKPKNLNAALQQLSVVDFEAHLEQFKSTSPVSKVHWLKCLTSYLNGALPYDCDPTFAGKPIDYPSNMLSAPLKSVIVKFLQDIGPKELEFYHPLLLDSMASDLNNNLHVMGYKILLQLIGQNWPFICTSHLVQKALMRNSYQNSSAVYLSILWAHGQGGYYDLTEGVQVWANLMLPSLELKNYTKFIVEYIEKILTLARDQRLNINQDEFFKCYHALRGSYINIPKELQQSLKRSSALLLLKYISSCIKHANIFLNLLRMIESPTKQRIELDGCISCLVHGEVDCLRVWKMNYKKQQLPSALLLHAIADDWPTIRKKLGDVEAFLAHLNELGALNEQLASKKNEGKVEKLKLAITAVQEKIKTQPKRKQNAAASGKRSGRSCYKWIFGIFLLLGLIIATISYDIQVYGNGQLERSNLGNALKKVGLLKQVEHAWFVSASASARGYKWAEHQVPIYVSPAVKAACDLTKIARNFGARLWSNTRVFLSGRYNALTPYVESRFPGLVAKIEISYIAVHERVSTLYANSLDLIRAKVLVGRFSPENLNRALNDTRNAALVYYNRFRRNVDAYAQL